MGRRVAHMVTGEVNTGFWCGELRERDQLEELDLDGRIILQETQCTNKRNIEACLPKNCCRGQAISITYSVCVCVYVCVCVCSLIYSKCKADVPYYIAVCDLSGCTVLST
jgi:hypothetical protein